MAVGWSIALLIAAMAGVGTYVALQWAAHEGHIPKDDMYSRAFDAFVDRYKKTYTSPEERLKRFDIFKANYALIQAENAKGLSYTLAINAFADQTLQELSSTQLGLSAPAPHELWNDVPHLGTDLYSGAPLLDSVDWTSKGGVTDVKNQKQCGSCWAFSSTGALEGAWFVETGKLVALSEQQLIDCDRDGELGCKGGSMQGAFSWLKAQQVCTEESYAYEMEQGLCQTTCMAGIPLGGVKGYVDVPPDDEKALMEAVAQQPVSVAIEADQKAFQLYSSGVLTKQCGSKLDHGVLLVGYGTEEGVNYWKIKNSWGPDWGEQGYVRLERGVKKQGECGINSQPVYPIVDGHPSPQPPSPAPPSPPKPPAGKSHYEGPPCQTDEVKAVISNAEGTVVCAPPCTNSDTCPTDVPRGTDATPMCILEDQEHHEYCALVCRSSSACPPSSKCTEIGSVGICVYPDALNMAKPERLKIKLTDDVQTIAV